VITDNSYLAIDLRRLAEDDALAKALLLVSRAKSKIPPDLKFSAVHIWPALEPPQEADQLCLGSPNKAPAVKTFSKTGARKAEPWSRRWWPSSKRAL
jgi:hypothetical protein